MAYPTGSGSEVLARTTIHAQSDTATSFRWDGTMATTGTSTYTVPANHIITVLSVIATDQGSASELINMYMNDGSNNISIISSQAIGSLDTFVWNDKFVLIGGDKLVVDTETSANVDFICSYIDQDWT
tara:strand:- start:97 stop:480 length:384 start_codon:yes stop_codon:yes gene_type:complete